jgi:hypothetical protein
MRWSYQKRCVEHLPMHVRVHVGKPGQRVQVSLRWQSGIQLERTSTLLADPSGQGLFVANLDCHADHPVTSRGA